MHVPPRINDAVFAGYEDEYVYAKVEEKRPQIEVGSSSIIITPELLLRWHQTVE